MTTAPIRQGQIIPYFNLPEAGGGRVNRWQFRGRQNMVMIFFPDADYPPCLELLNQLNAAAYDLAAEEAVTLAFIHGDTDKAYRFKRENGLTYPVLADESGAVFAQYGAVHENPPYAAFQDIEFRERVLVVDRFGEIYFAGSTLPSLAEIMDWLDFIERQCPE